MKNNKEIEEFQLYVIAEAKSQNKNPEQYVKELGESGLKEAYKRFQAYKKKQAQKAAHGAKLQYFRALKNQCANDEELVYFKRGGVVDCGCLKKQEGGKTEPIKKGNIIDRFKAKKAQIKAKLSRIANERKEGWDKHGNYIVTKKGIEERKRLLDANKTEEETTPPNINRGIGKNCNGAKMKLKKGDKVCPKCGKVHAAGMGCAVAKFKMHRLGGSLNGIPFYQQGTIRGGIYGLIDNTKNFIKGIAGDLTPLRYLNNPNTYTQGGFYKYLYNPLLKKWTILRGMHGALNNKYTKGRNTSIKTISGNNLFFTPVNSTFDSYNDGTTEFRNDGTVYYKGNKI